MDRDADDLVRIEGLSFRRGKRVILDNVDLRIARGRITSILGPSGTGKSTLLNLITGQLKPDAGKVYFDGVDVASLDRKGLYAIRRRMGMMFQSSALFTDLNVFDNVAFPLTVHTKLSAAEIQDKVMAQLDAVGLKGAWNLQPSELSGGMSRRVALARATIMNPDLVLYDEPFTGQDPIAKAVVARLIKTLNNTMKLTSVLVSHDVGETMEMSDYLYVISDAKIIAEGDPEQLRANDSPALRQFLNGEPDGPVPFRYPEEAAQPASGKHWFSFGRRA